MTWKNVVSGSSGCQPPLSFFDAVFNETVYARDISDCVKITASRGGGEMAVTLHVAGRARPLRVHELRDVPDGPAVRAGGRGPHCDAAATAARHAAFLRAGVLSAKPDDGRRREAVAHERICFAAVRAHLAALLEAGLAQRVLATLVAAERETAAALPADDTYAVASYSMYVADAPDTDAAQARVVIVGRRMAASLPAQEFVSFGAVYMLGARGDEEHVLALDFEPVELRHEYRHTAFAYGGDAWDAVPAATKKRSRAGAASNSPAAKRRFQFAKIRFIGSREHGPGTAIVFELSDSVAPSLETLDFSHHGIHALPAWVAEYTNLKTLILRGCTGLDALPAWIAQLGKLETLDLSMTKIVHLPAELSSLRNLKTLLLHGCTSLSLRPNDFPKTTSSLETLDLSGANIVTLDLAFSKLRALKTLSLRNCQRIRKLPEAITALTALETLDLSHSSVATFPASLAGLGKLAELDLSYCANLATLATSLDALKSLRKLDLSHSHIERLPASLGQITTLTTLLLRWCRLLEALPDLSGLVSLETLVLAQSGIAQLPDSVDRLARLKTLDLRWCAHLTALPDAFAALGALETVLLEGTPVARLPPSLTALAARVTQ